MEGTLLLPTCHPSHFIIYRDEHTPHKKETEGDNTE